MTHQPIRPEDVPDEWVALAVRANADRNHADLCHCDGWPDDCVTGYTTGQWEHGDEADTIAAAAPAIREQALREEAESLHLRATEYEPGAPLRPGLLTAARYLANRARGENR